jgi:hypothetical protein
MLDPTKAVFSKIVTSVLHNVQQHVRPRAIVGRWPNQSSLYGIRMMQKNEMFFFMERYGSWLYSGLTALQPQPTCEYRCPINALKLGDATFGPRLSGWPLLW